eukprot:351204-Chlamydomonas_euryale.AAC.4
MAVLHGRAARACCMGRHMNPSAAFAVPTPGPQGHLGEDNLGMDAVDVDWGRMDFDISQLDCVVRSRYPLWRGGRDTHTQVRGGGALRAAVAVGSALKSRWVGGRGAGWVAGELLGGRQRRSWVGGGGEAGWVAEEWLGGRQRSRWVGGGGVAGWEAEEELGGRQRRGRERAKGQASAVSSEVLVSLK